MSQPDEIRRFVLDHYVLPARERGQEWRSGMLLKQSRGNRRSMESIRSAKRMRSGGPHPSIDRFIPSKQFTLFLLMSQMKLSSSRFWSIMGTGE